MKKRNPLISTKQVTSIVIFGVVQTAIWLIVVILGVGVLLALCRSP